MVEFLTKAWEFVAEHWEFLTAVLGIVLGWFSATAKFHLWLDKAEEQYMSAKKWAKSKDLYKAAQTAYSVVNKISRETENTIDDKAAKGLEIALELMQKLGWDQEDLGNGEKDVILKVFEELHENKNLAVKEDVDPLQDSGS